MGEYRPVLFGCKLLASGLAWAAKNLPSTVSYGLLFVQKIPEGTQFQVKVFRAKAKKCRDFIDF